MSRNLDTLWALATARFALGADSLHGPNHWQRVERNAIKLASIENADVVRVFAIIHDSCRTNEHHDPQHGQRAADWARELRSNELRWIDDDSFERLCDALKRHDRGQTSDDPLIGACWDADRLDLGRVNISPHARFMSTALGRQLCGERIER